MNTIVHDSVYTCVHLLVVFLIPLDFHLSLHFFAYVRISATLQKMACQDVRALCTCACVCACLVFCVTLDGVTGFPIKLNHRPDQC